MFMLPIQNVTNALLYENVPNKRYWSNIPEEFKSEIKNKFFFHSIHLKVEKIGIPLKRRNNFRNIFNLYEKTNFLKTKGLQYFA